MRRDDPASCGICLMSWLLLLLAGLFEVAWAIGLKYTDGFSRPLPTLLTLSAMGVSLLLLAMAVKQLPLGTAYAVWTGIGAVGTVLMGIWLFNEPATLARVLCLLLIIGGILGLKFIG
ncbi:Guanidinium exporter [Aeromonas dhakensis]